ncbi:MAG: hypothetical protein Q9164_002835 [Protoblastenia rupestris]
MAHKAAKQLATRNTTILTRTHLISLFLHALFILLRFLLFRSTTTRTSYLLYTILASPSLIVEFWFEKVGRPTRSADGSVEKSGEDLEAKGLTEYLWDVLYWTWACIAGAAAFGDRAWWLWGAVPLYSGWLAWSTYTGMGKGLGGMMGQNGVGGHEGAGGESKRQKKMEKRGGQRMQYR